MMLKYLLALVLGIGSLSFNTAWAYSFVSCIWDPSNELIPKTSLKDVVESGISWDQVKYDCRKEEDGVTRCEYKNIWRIANRTYSTSQSVKLACVNLGDQSEKLSFAFTRVSGFYNTSSLWHMLNMSISGAGTPLNLTTIEDMDQGKQFEWGNVTLKPCIKNCDDIAMATPRHTMNLTFTFSVRPKSFTVDYSDYPYYNLQDPVGFISVLTGENKESSWTTTGQSFLSICGLGGETTCVTYPTGNGGAGGGWNKPPIKKCTLTVVTPDAVAFQPISSDDLSRNRVRTEDFTLTVIKGPDQSMPCMGSAYNLPGEIKTQGGYSINSTFWGISHSSGAPQGIGLKLYDLGKGDYLRFNYKYPSFIRNISSISESKRIRAEISATTRDLKKIKDGTYSQVLTFEVKMP